MNDLIPSYEPETGQVILDGTPAGPAGEAALSPVAGVELAFDRADGHLVRGIVEADSAAAATLLARLFGPVALGVLSDAGHSADLGSLSPQAGLCAALSALARLDAARPTSPVPAGSPWWAAEAAVLAERAGLHARALAEAGRAVDGLGTDRLAVPVQAVETARAAAAITGVGPGTARRLTEGIVVAQPPSPSGAPGGEVAAEVERMEKDSIEMPGLHWMLDPGLAAAGLFRPGLSPHSDLLVRRDGNGGRVLVRATLASGADRAAVGRSRVRLVDPAERRVLAQAGFGRVGSQARAELAIRFPPDEPKQAWLEVVEGDGRPVLSAKVHWIRRALRWADAALRAERAPAGIAPRSTTEDWAALAALAWERCRRDWAAAGDPGRAAAALGSRTPLPEPACVAEIVGE